jgi:hypothetical protein
VIADEIANVGPSFDQTALDQILETENSVHRKALLRLSRRASVGKDRVSFLRFPPYLYD